MKISLRLISLILLLFICSSVAPSRTMAQSVSVGFQVFYDELSPYGTWVQSPEYGYVWVPDVDPGFTPYSTNGYWVFTSEGWTWVSNYSWGWAPFHYGRWYMDDVYGAMWVPDYEWGPGWVTWRRSAGFYGWAPIGPGVSISIAYGNNYYVPNNQWTFVRDGDFGRTNINQYYINTTYNVTIINSSTVIHNTRVNRSRHVSYHAGPDRGEAEKRAGRTFTPVTIKENSKPGQRVSKNQMELYRPKIQKNNSGRVTPVPARVERLESVKPAQRQQSQPANQRSTQKQQQPQQRQEAQPQQRQQAQPQQRQQAQPAQQKQVQKPQQQQQKPKQQQMQRQQPKPGQNEDKGRESPKTKPPKTM